MKLMIFDIIVKMYRLCSANLPLVDVTTYESLKSYIKGKCLGEHPFSGLEGMRVVYQSFDSSKSGVLVSGHGSRYLGP